MLRGENKFPESLKPWEKCFVLFFPEKKEKLGKIEIYAIVMFIS